MNDTTATTDLSRGLSVVISGLNLNNDVFGFYNGSPQYVVQRRVLTSRRLRSAFD